MRAGVLIILVLVLIFADSAEGTTTIVIASDPVVITYPFVFEGPSTYTLYVMVLNNSTGLTAVQFAAPLPDCMANATLISESSDHLKIGSIETGVQVAFSACLAGPIEVMRLTFVSTGIDTCCPWGIVPDPAVASGEIEGVDCGLNVVAIHGLESTVVPDGFEGCGSPTVPSNPSPPHGATGQPFNVTLDWDSEPTAGTGLGVFFGVVYLGTEPDPPPYASMVEPPHTVGPLEPATTYFWKIVSVVSDYGSTEGPVWQFTTQTGPNPVKTSTWGAIKALYRE